MSFSGLGESKRQVVPRWHTFTIARYSGLLNSFNLPPHYQETDNHFYKEKEDDWLNHQTLSHAIDFAGTGLVLNDFQNSNLLKAAEFILKNEKTTTKLVSDLAKNICKINKTPNTKEELPSFPGCANDCNTLIRNFRHDLRDYPRNPIKWVDLAFYYCLVGLVEKAQYAINVALNLSPQNRFILRSAARFFLHINKADKALFYLRRAEGLKYDSWLLASEIAISEVAKRPSKLIKLGKKLVENKNINPFHLSELAASLGTIEIYSGANRKGKKLFKTALEKPTENSVAQFVSLMKDMGSDGTETDVFSLAKFHEAEARYKFQLGKYRDAFNGSKNWWMFQPFSSEPAIFASYIASVALEDYESALDIAKKAQCSSPKEFLLKNNEAFSLASLNRPEEASTVLDGVSFDLLDENDQGIFWATKGLIEFRRENYEKGRSLYSKAIEVFKNNRYEKSTALAKFFLAKEERRIEPTKAKASIDDAINALKNHKIPETEHLIEKWK